LGRRSNRNTNTLNFTPNFYSINKFTHGTANPTSTQTAAPSSVIPEISIVAVPLLLAGASAVLLLAKSAKNKF
jgi:hypothetical protein